MEKSSREVAVTLGSMVYHCYPPVVPSAIAPRGSASRIRSPPTSRDGKANRRGIYPHPFALAYTEPRLRVSASGMSRPVQGLGGAVDAGSCQEDRARRLFPGRLQEPWMTEN
jgi:hypothetical protein